MRKLILGGAAAATVLAAWFAPDDEGVIVSPAAATVRPAYDATAAAVAAARAAGPESQHAAGGLATPAIPVELQIQRRVADEELGDLFASQGWQAPSPLKPAAARAPQDQPAGGHAGAAGLPPLPFQFVGLFIDDGKTAYFLQMEEHNIVARVGEKVSDNYQLDEAANGTLTFTYLPLKQKQTLAVGDTN